MEVNGMPFHEPNVVTLILGGRNIVVDVMHYFFSFYDEDEKTYIRVPIDFEVELDSMTRIQIRNFVAVEL
eukprot:2712443-Rhodomonas_salina.1